VAAVAAVSAVGAVPGVAGASAALPGLPTTLSSSPGYVVRPAEIDYTGDGSGILGGFDGTGRRGHFGHLHWRFWGTTHAAGSGAVWLDDCLPDCAAGVFHPYAVTLRASAPRGGHFALLTLRYRYHGRDVVDRRAVVGFAYQIAGGAAGRGGPPADPGRSVVESGG
jgi:hypothetical protein